MIGKIFNNYFLWFDGTIADRHIILLIDKFSVYYTEINLLQEEFLQKLINIKIIFFKQILYPFVNPWIKA